MRLCVGARLSIQNSVANRFISFNARSATLQGAQSELTQAQLDAGRAFFSRYFSPKRQIDSLKKKNITSASSEVYSEANSPKGNDPRRHLKELSDKWQLTAYLKKPASCLSVIKRPIKAIVFFLINLYRIIRSLTSGSKLCQTKGVGCV